MLFLRRAVSGSMSERKMEDEVIEEKLHFFHYKNVMSGQYHKKSDSK